VKSACVGVLSITNSTFIALD